MKSRYLQFSVSCFLGVATWLPASDLPPLINFQGRLAKPDGSRLVTADHELRLALYDAPTNGNLIWGPQVFDGAIGAGHGPRVPVVQGYFNVMIGPVDAGGRSILDAFNGSQRFVQVSVSNRPPIQPRQQILAAPFALQAANGSPPGSIIAFGGTNVPAGWMLCDGRPLKSVAYPLLFDAIRTAWGDASDDGDPTTDFRAPDLRGLFLRGVDDSPLMGSAQRDPDRGETNRVRIHPGSGLGNRVGSFQDDALMVHRHTIRRMVKGGVARNPVAIFADDEGTDAFSGDYGGNVINNAGTSSEVRPKNAYVNYIIKY